MATVELGDPVDRIDVRQLAGRPLGFRVPVLQADGTAMESGDVVSARAQVRPQIGSAEILYTFDTTDEGAELVDIAGACWVRLTATSERTTEWQLLWPGRAPETVVWWDLEITDGDGETHQITEPGKITLIHQVTR
jgi:hypothetical protein